MAVHKSEGTAQTQTIVSDIKTRRGSKSYLSKLNWSCTSGFSKLKLAVD
jgi:hypothetical protein